MKKIAVTGANGFIGSRLCSYLSESGHEVLCLVRESAKTDLLSKESHIIKIDYDDSNSLQSALEGVEVIIHLAALTRAKTWEEFQKVNVDFVERLIDISNQSPSIEHFIFMSSQAAAGPSSSAAPKKEDEPCNPVTMYGTSKLKAEKILLQNSQKAWSIFRAVSVFGPGEKDFLEYYRMIDKGIAPLIGMCDKYISLIYVDDLCKMISLAIGNKKAENQVFFAAGSEHIRMAGFSWLVAKSMNKKVFTFKVPEPLLWTVAVILELISKASKRPPVLNREKFKEMRQRYWLADNSKAKELLGYSQGSTLVKQMQETINWYKKEGIL